MKLVFTPFSLILVLLVGAASPAFAQMYESPLTPNQTSSVLGINKTVQKPGTTDFTENLNANDPKFFPGALVPFRITVTNTGSSRLSNIQVRDNFPRFLTNEKNNSSSATFSIPSLDPGKSQTFAFNGRLATAANLPADQQVFCLVNQGVVTSGTQTSTDTAQLCVQNTAATATPSASATTNQATTKGGLPIYAPQSLTTTPNTGPEVLALGALFPSGILGYFLRKKAK